MLFDDENDILQFARMSAECDPVLCFNRNSFNKKIRRCLMDEQGLISDNGHDALPPDFYSVAHNMMFDVLRINDSEIKKTYNPVKIRERNMRNEVLEKFGDILVPNGRIICISESDAVGEHTYKNYVKNGSRVIGKHVKQIPFWEQKCQNIKYKGLFIFDETEVYYKGISIPTGCSEPGMSWFRGIDMRCKLHKPWLDERLIRPIYESKLDFVIWFCPYKTHGIACQVGLEFPCIVIIDTRFRFNGYVAYPDDLVC